MKNWQDDSVTISDEFQWLEGCNDATLVAEKFGIPFQTADLSEQYNEGILDYMFLEYEKGRTPNPDVLFNKEIKFDVFMKIGLELGADCFATGNYLKNRQIAEKQKNKAGKLHGVFKWYSEAQIVLKNFISVNGELHGVSKFYNPMGTIS